jgi:hypothetical protein
MSTSSKAIFTKRLYLTWLASEEKCGYLHFQEGDTPVFTETGEPTQKIIATFLVGMDTAFDGDTPPMIGPAARIEVIWYKPQTDAKPIRSGALVYDAHGNLLFHAREARTNKGSSNGDLLRTILQGCHIPEGMIADVFSDDFSKKVPNGHQDSYAIVFSRERLDDSGKPTGELTCEWRRGLANKALAALKKV